MQDIDYEILEELIIEQAIIACRTYEDNKKCTDSVQFRSL